MPGRRVPGNGAAPPEGSGGAAYGADGGAQRAGPRRWCPAGGADGSRVPAGLPVGGYCQASLTVAA
ncbi:hypothetical protein GCM10009760_58640 [Kitasatospora kazusensis]|uniref:Uncharacterized protein n=1 Tax=Kitasatospora kazusensis TaxID=407974 RepID=A0ABN3AAD5_9ACTN